MYKTPLARSFFFKKKIGANRNGNRTNALIDTAPGIVSVKTTTIWYVPAGVEADVAIVTVFAEGE